MVEGAWLFCGRPPCPTGAPGFFEEDRALKNTIRIILALWLAGSMSVPPLQAQDFMSKVMKKEYRARSVSCTACHPKEEEEKTEDKLTPFGLVVAKLLEGKMVTERLNAAEQESKEAMEELEDEFEKEFPDVLKKLNEMKAPSGKTYEEAIQAGEIEGIKPRT
jgi:hypothetical protein